MTIAIATLPLILLALMIGTRLLSMLAGPVNIWNTASRAPAIQDLIGVYELTEKSQEFLSSQLMLWPKQSGFKLEANHKAAVFGVPAFDGTGRRRGCDYNGIGNWRLFEEWGEVTIYLSITAPPGSMTSCRSENLGGMVLLGHSAPYSAWYYIGDPDEDRGLTFRRR